MKIEDRDYQNRAVDHLLAALPTDRRVLAVGPTGSGKTVIVAKLIQAMPIARVLFLAHSYELIDQAYGRLANAGIRAGIIMAGEEQRKGKRARVDRLARVQVASVQTIARRKTPLGVDLIVVDEAHRTMAASYLAIADRYPNAMVLGVTATPERMDGKPLGDFYRSMHVIAQPSELYEIKRLAKPRVFAAPPDVVAEIGARLREVRTKKGDFDHKGLSKAIDRTPLIGSAVDEAIRLAPGMPKVAFACSVKHSKALCAKFIAAGVTAVHVDGTTPDAERDAALAALRDGTVEVVCNVDVLGEGYDLPRLGAVLIVRPTKSLTRFMQMAGRVQRIDAGKKRPIVIDHGNNVQRLKFIPGEDHEWSLFPKVKARGGSGSDGDPAVRVCSQCQACFEAKYGACPDCGAVSVRSRTEKDEIAARLVEVTERRRAAASAILEEIAARSGAPATWVEAMAQ